MPRVPVSPEPKRFDNHDPNGEQAWRIAFRFMRLRDGLSQRKLAEQGEVNVSVIELIEAGKNVDRLDARAAMKNCLGFDTETALVCAYDAVPEEEKKRVLARSYTISNMDVLPEHRLAFRTLYYHRNESYEVLAQRTGVAETTVAKVISDVNHNKRMTVRTVENFIHKAWGLTSLATLIKEAEPLAKPTAAQYKERFPSHIRFIDYDQMITQGEIKGNKID